MVRSSTVVFPQLMVLPQPGAQREDRNTLFTQWKIGRSLPHATKIPRIPHEKSALLGRLETQMYLHYYRRQFYSAEPNKLEISINIVYVKVHVRKDVELDEADLSIKYHPPWTEHEDKFMFYIFNL